jgi:hypothetical protein
LVLLVVQVVVLVVVVLVQVLTPWISKGRALRAAATKSRFHCLQIEQRPFDGRQLYRT